MTLPPLQPARAFSGEPQSANTALAVVGIVALVSALALLPIGWVVATSFGPATTVANPDRPPESACEAPDPMTVDGETVDFGTPEGCTEAARVTVRSVVWRIVGQQAILQFLSTLASWVLVVGAFYALSREHLDGRDAIVVTGWGTVPWAVGALVTTVVLVLTVGSPATASGSPEAIADALVGAFRARLPVALVVQASVAAWAGWIHYHGLRVRADLSNRRSIEIAAVLNASAYLIVLASSLTG